MITVLNSAQLREKSPEDLQALLFQVKQELFELRFQRRLTELKQTHRFALLRRFYARVLTVMNDCA